MKPEAQSIVLEVSFDVDQTSAGLDWHVVATDCDGEPRKGKYAGGILFLKGETFYLRVTGFGSDRSKFDSFKVLECCIVTRPQIVACGPHMKTVYAPPSPFFRPEDPSSPMGPSYQLPLQFSPTAVMGYGRDRKFTLRWDDRLKVGQTEGRWNLSFIIMVSIERGQGNDPEIRVFSFDPESEVGDGADL